LSLEQALGEHYLMVDWGLTHALQHRRLFPDAPEPMTRLASGTMALQYMLALGGAAYLPEHIVAPVVAAKQLFWVEEAPVIKHRAHAVYPVRTGRKALIENVLSYFQVD
jgi:DNA-binding transcriptional LysR family regulator